MAVAAAPALGATCAPGTPDPKAERALLKLVNNARASAGLNTLPEARTVRRPARAASAQMARGGAFQHRHTGWMRGMSGAQNLAMTAHARQAYAAMMASRPHRANILGRKWRSVGIGAARGCGAHRYFTLNFAGKRLR